MHAYDGEGNIVKSIDKKLKKEYNYTYEEGSLVRAVEYDITLNSDGIVTSKTRNVAISYVYENGELKRKRVLYANGEEHITTITDGETTVMSSVTSSIESYLTRSLTDGLGRKASDYIQSNQAKLERTFSYHNGEATLEHYHYNRVDGIPTTNLVSKIEFNDGRTLHYEYDNEERITKVTDSLEGVSEYTYDERGQLLKETRDNVVINEMVYSVGGNIKYKNGKTYSYDGDILTSYNGKLLSYDAQGNPILYRGHSLAWEKGRQLKSFDSNSYSYNANGIRTSKRVNGVLHKYYLDGAKILKETYGDNTIIPLYDSEDSVCGINYNGTSYFFYKNLQGDIIALANANGVIAARYTYDAWGKCTVKDAHGNTNTLADFIGNINPFRYRGYYYDSETKLYYLQSRYYDAEIGRFVNGDEATYIGASGTLLGYNLYAYCENNAVNMLDVFGNKPINMTNRLISIMKKNASYLYSLAKLYRWAGLAGKMALLYKFYSLVKTNGKWDLKNQSNWKLKAGDWYTFMGKKVTLADIGNIHFGFVGSVLFSQKTLCAGAGVYQIFSGTSSWEFWYSFFDDPRDTLCILIGRALWKIKFKKWVYQW